MAGFRALKFVDADVVLDGGYYGSDGGSGIPDGVGYFLNTDYIHWRPHRDANMRALSEVNSINQAASVRLIHWMGALTSSGLFQQGRLAT